MNLIQKSTKIHQLDVVTSIANNILSFLKFRFNSNPLSFHLPNYEIFDYILPANSPIEMVFIILLFLFLLLIIVLIRFVISLMIMKYLLLMIITYL